MIMMTMLIISFFYLFLYLTRLLFVLPYLFSCEFCVDGVWSSVIVIHYGPWQKPLWPSADVLGSTTTSDVSMETLSQPYHWALITVRSMHLISSVCNCEHFLSRRKKREEELTSYQPYWYIRVIYIFKKHLDISQVHKDWLGWHTILTFLLLYIILLYNFNIF